MKLIQSLMGVLLIVASAGRAFAGDKHALLIGCTKYPNIPGLHELYGPANDMPLWSKLLTSPSPGGFAFAEKDVQQLLGWTEDAATRPTRANIESAFKSLIEKSQPGSQIVIVLSGHGTQQPIPDGQDPFDADNPEPDGLDEVFLPADVVGGSPAVGNGIVDNQISEWLQEMRTKGANVWIVFDCCHSGTMTRGSDDEVERVRSVEPQLLGISSESLDGAARRAEAAAASRKNDGLPLFAVPEKIAANTNASQGTAGSLVAFYAAQPFEKAPELPLPEGTAHVRENYYGLLSYTLVQTLMERRAALSYRELARLIATGYRARRGTRFPTPFAEGDLDREVLSTRVWPLRSQIFVDASLEALSVNAGEVHGLTVDSVLALYPPLNSSSNSKTVLGYARVTNITPTTASIVACEFNNSPAPSMIPHLSVCEIASRSFGDLRIRVFLEPRHIGLHTAVKGLDKEVASQIQFTDAESEAQWQLRVVKPEDASKLNIADERVVLLPGAGWEKRPQGSKSISEMPKYFAAYEATDTKSLIGELERDLPKLFRWQNLWRVSGGVHSIDGGETHGLKFEAFKLTDLQDQTGEPMRKGILRAGDMVKFTLKNEGVQNLWVTLLYLDSNFGVKHLYAGQIEAGRELKPFKFRMTPGGNWVGQEGMIVFASPVIDKTAPDFRFLEQEPLLVESVRTKGTEEIPLTPFGQLLKSAAFNNGTRGMEPVVATTPAIVAQTWLLVP